MSKSTRSSQSGHLHLEIKRALFTIVLADYPTNQLIYLPVVSIFSHRLSDDVCHL